MPRHGGPSGNDHLIVGAQSGSDRLLRTLHRRHTFMPLPGTPLEDAPSGSVDPTLHSLLDHLASQGHQVGQWRKQAEIARQPEVIA